MWKRKIHPSPVGLNNLSYLRKVHNRKRNTIRNTQKINRKYAEQKNVKTQRFLRGSDLQSYVLGLVTCAPDKSTMEQKSTVKYAATVSPNGPSAQLLTHPFSKWKLQTPTSKLPWVPGSLKNLRFSSKHTTAAWVTEKSSKYSESQFTR